MYAAICFSCSGLALLAMAVQRRSQPMRKAARGLLITYFTVLLIFGAGEFFFRYVFAESENVFTWATHNWVERYWHNNSLGFRDREWTAADIEGKQTIMVTGDSFAAGWGINDPADRFSSVLAKHLGDGYAVINLGIYGTGTPEQLDILEKYPLKKPDVVIMQYFLNDLEPAAIKLGLLEGAKPRPIWTAGSALLDFVYVRVLSQFLEPDYNRDWWQWNYDAYNNEAIWNAHKQELEAYIDYVESIHARLIVVIFPETTEPLRGIDAVNKVAQVFRARGHDDILDLTDQLAAWKPEDRVVSAQDGHPSVAFHHLVGDLIYQRFFAPEITTGQ
jgi:hypothetical protein